MQCLIRTEPFSEAILKLNPSKSTPLINGFIKTIKEYTTKDIATVTDIHEKLAETDTLFTVGKMSDSFHALCKIITLMAEEVKHTKSSSPANVFKHSLVNRSICCVMVSSISSL